MLLQMIRNLALRGCRVFTEVHVGFFAVRRSLFHSSRANQHREVKYLLLVLIGCLVYEHNLHLRYDHTSACRSLYSVKTKTRHISKTSILFYSTLNSTTYLRYIFPLDPHTVWSFQLPPAKSFISKTLFWAESRYVIHNNYFVYLCYLKYHI